MSDLHAFGSRGPLASPACGVTEPRVRPGGLPTRSVPGGGCGGEPPARTGRWFPDEREVWARMIYAGMKADAWPGWFATFTFKRDISEKPAWCLFRQWEGRLESALRTAGVSVPVGAVGEHDRTGHDGRDASDMVISDNEDMSDINISENVHRYAPRPGVGGVSRVLLRWIAVEELQVRGVIHLHAGIVAPYLDRLRRHSWQTKWERADERAGLCRILELQTQACPYLAKYLTKLEATTAGTAIQWGGAWRGIRTLGTRRVRLQTRNADWPAPPNPVQGR